MTSLTFEVCVDSVEGAVAAQSGGAHRVELCENLVEGGTTPSFGTIRLARANLNIGLHVIIRPRGGDFCYTDMEMAVMEADIRAVREVGADGVVIGILLPDGRVDVDRTRVLVEAARPMRVTFHRAIDLTRDPLEALEAIAELGIERILTSGQQASALDGAVCIASLVRQSAGRVAIMAGGGVNAENLPALLAATGVNEVHFSARSWLESPMSFRRAGVFMGKAYSPDEYSRKVTDPELVRQVIASA